MGSKRPYVVTNSFPRGTGECAGQMEPMHATVCGRRSSGTTQIQSPGETRSRPCVHHIAQALVPWSTPGKTSHSNPNDFDWQMRPVLQDGRAERGNVRKLSRAQSESRRIDSAIVYSLLCQCHDRLDMTDISPRVNGARMSDYIGRPVRLICKVTKVRVYSPPDTRRANLTPLRT